MAEPKYIKGGAIFSEDWAYRYLLWRKWEENLPSILFVLCNPSTADADKLDPTLRRCVAYAQEWGFGQMVIANIFAYRATDPEVMRRKVDPVGPKNNEYIIEAAQRASLVVAGWGNHGAFRRRGEEVLSILSPLVDLHALRTTRAGHPSHPLYLPRTLRPFLWRSRDR